MARAGRLGEAGATNDVAEAIVTASLILDSVEITLADFPKKLDQLKTAPLSYSRSEEQKRLLTNYSELVDNYRMLDERATVMRKETVGQAALAREYIRTHELSRAKIKDGVTTAILLAELKATTAKRRSSSSDCRYKHRVGEDVARTGASTDNELGDRNENQCS